jgi:pimeloyl-ACP methyl ester carboxylesterase
MAQQEAKPTSDRDTIAFDMFGPLTSYIVDATQRGILFLDVMRQRGNAYRAHMAETAPHVLNYEAQLVVDGRSLEHPVNYVLVKIIPPASVEVDERLRPFVVVDPRAGHGPGIGGFKSDSEIGVALQAGHPCYFVGFLPDPMPGQTIEHIARAEAVFLERVIKLHPHAEGRPCVIGNCQAGWAVMMLAAIRPELFGPLIIAGSPLAYWGGVRGKYPMRYSGGLLGGSWLTALTSDLGHGKFDGAWLVQNFENQNPSNTLWTKQYNVYSKIDTEPARYLEFERWWGGHVNLNAEEIQFIVDELFVGNNLAAGRIQTSDKRTIDLRNIRSPIVVFCSKGDNVTPPQQALGWIPELYEDVDEIRSYGQTIVYTIHETIGHLGIFVSGGVARKEHSEFSSNIDLIDVLPPGLYEAVFERKSGATTNPDLAGGEWIMRCEARTIDDIRALGGNDLEDERRFATAARVSEINLGLYHTFVQPFVRAATSPGAAEFMRQMHPLRLQYEMLSDANPFMSWVSGAADKARQNRRADAANPLLKLQENVSQQIVRTLDAWRDTLEKVSEQTFLVIYGSPLLQAAVGIDPSEKEPLRHAPRDLLHQQLIQERIAEIKAKIPQGGIREATIRAVLYVGMVRGSVDERSFEMVRQIRRGQADLPTLPLADFKKLLREQYFMLLLDQAAAIAAIPAMLPPEPETRGKALELVNRIVQSPGALLPEGQARLQQVAQLFGRDEEPTLVPANDTAKEQKASKAMTPAPNLATPVSPARGSGGRRA